MSDVDLRQFLSIPYIKKGRGFDGSDCKGLIILYYKTLFNIDIPDILEEYAPEWSLGDRNSFVQNYHKFFEPVKLPKKHDLILFQDRAGVVNHGGIIRGYGKFIHCCEDGTLIDSYHRDMWIKRFNGFYRVKHD